MLNYEDFVLGHQGVRDGDSWHRWVGTTDKGCQERGRGTIWMPSEH